MAKIKTAVSGNPFGKKLLNSLKKYWFVWIVGIGLVGFFGVYRPVSVYLDKQRFLRAEKEIEEVAEQIQAKIGPADQVKRGASCSYASRKFERGPLSCGVGVHGIYIADDPSSANSILEKVVSIKASTLYPGASQQGATEFKDNKASHVQQSFTQDFYSSGLLCKIEYVFPAEVNLEEYFPENDTRNIRITTRCSGDARAEHFPVTD